jgi:acyl-CoA oxidase
LVGLLSAVAGGGGREEDGSKVGLPAMDLALAFPQATPASIFPPSGENFLFFL